MYVVTNLVFRLGLTWRLDALIPIAYVLVGAVGFALIIAGLTLVLKRIEMFNDLVLLFLMFLQRRVIAVDKLRPPSEPSALRLSHPSRGRHTKIMLDNQQPDLLGSGGYLWLTVSAAAGSSRDCSLPRLREHRERNAVWARY